MDDRDSQQAYWPRDVTVRLLRRVYLGHITLKKKHHWIDIAEYATLVGLGLGSVATFVSAQFFYSSAPLSLLILLNLANRNRLEQVMQDDTEAAIGAIDRKVSKNLETLSHQIQALPTPEAMGSLRKSMLVKNRELAERLSGEIKTLQDGLQAVLTMVDRLKLGTVRQDMEALRQQYDALNNGVVTLTSQFQHLTTSGKAEKVEQAIAQLKTETERLRNNLQAIADQTRPTLTSLQDQITHLNRQFQKLPPPFDSTALKQEVSELMRMVADLVPRRDWSTLVTEMQSLQKLQASQSEAEEALRRKLQDLNLQLQSRPTKSSLTSLQNQINHLNRQFQKLPPPFDPTSLKKEVAKLLKVVSELVPKRDFGGLVAQVKALQQQQEFQMRVEQTLQSELQLLNHQLQALMADPQALREDTDAIAPPEQKEFQGRLEDMLQQELTQISEQLQQLPTGSEFQTQVEAMLRQELLDVNRQLQRYPEGPKYEFVLDFKSAASPLEPAGTPGVDVIHSSRTILAEALATTQERLILILPWSSQVGLDEAVMAQMEAFLQQNRRLDLGWCHQTDPTQPRLLSAIHQRWQLHLDVQSGLQETLQKLLWLKRTYPQVLQFKIMGTRETFLVSDQTYAVLGIDEALISSPNLPEMELKLRTTDEEAVRQLIQQFDTPDLPAHDVAAHWNRATTRLDLSDRQGALHDCNQILAVNPDNADALNFRGLIYYDMADRQKAIADFNHALQINPQLVPAYCNRGYIRSEMGDQLGAVADYSAALRMEPQSAVAHFLRGMACQKIGELEGAIADYTAALQLTPDSATLYYYRGLARPKLGDYAGAIADLEQALTRFTQWGQETNARKVFNYITQLQQVMATTVAAPQTLVTPVSNFSKATPAPALEEAMSSQSSQNSQSSQDPQDSQSSQSSRSFQGSQTEERQPMGEPPDTATQAQPELWADQALFVGLGEGNSDPNVVADERSAEISLAPSPALDTPITEGSDDTRPEIEYQIAEDMAESGWAEASQTTLGEPPMAAVLEPMAAVLEPMAAVLEPMAETETVQAAPSTDDGVNDSVAEEAVEEPARAAEPEATNQTVAELGTPEGSWQEEISQANTDPFAEVEPDESPEFNPFSIETLENFFDEVDREAQAAETENATSEDALVETLPEVEAKVDPELTANIPEAAIASPEAVDFQTTEAPTEPNPDTEPSLNTEPSPDTEPSLNMDTLASFFDEGFEDQLEELEDLFPSEKLAATSSLVNPTANSAAMPSLAATDSREEAMEGNSSFLETMAARLESANSSDQHSKKARTNGAPDPGTLTLSNFLEDLNQAGELDQALWMNDSDEPDETTLNHSNDLGANTSTEVDTFDRASDGNASEMEALKVAAGNADAAEMDADGTLSDLYNLF